MDLKRRMPLFRWSVWRMATGVRNITTTGQIGDVREAAAVDYVLQHARAGDIDDVLATVDKFAYEKSMLINVGDEKGLLLDAAVRSANPVLALELGQRPADMGTCRRRRPRDMRGRHHRRRRAHSGHAGQ